MTVTKDDARMLTSLALRIRRETYGAAVWDQHGTYEVISGLVGQHFVTTLEQVVRHAMDVEARTPGAIRRPFLPPPPEATAPPPDRCRDHPDELAPPYCRVHKTEYALSYGEQLDAEKTAPDLPAGVTGADLVRVTTGKPPKHQPAETETTPENSTEPEPQEAP